MKFYVSKYKIVTTWKFEEGRNIAQESIPEGTVFQITGMDNMGVALSPVSKKVDTKNGILTFSPEMLKLGFTESDYLPE